MLHSTTYIPRVHFTRSQLLGRHSFKFKFVILRHATTSSFLPAFREQLQALPEFQQTQQAWSNGNPVAALSSAERVTEITESIFGSDHGCTAVALAELVKAKHLAGATTGVVSSFDKLLSIGAVKETADALRASRLASAKARLITGDSVTGLTDVDLWDGAFMGGSAELWGVKAIRVGLVAAEDGLGFESCQACEEVMDKGAHVLLTQSGSLEVAKFLHTVAAFAVFSKSRSGEAFLKRTVEDSLRETELAFPELDLFAIVDGKVEGEDVARGVEDVVAKMKTHELSQLMLTLNLSALCYGKGDIVEARGNASTALRIADALDSGMERTREEAATKATILCTLAGCLYKGGSVLEAEGLYATGLDLYRGVKHPAVACKRSAQAHLLDYAALIDKWENRQGQAEELRIEASKLGTNGCGFIRAEFLMPLQSWCLPDDCSDTANAL